ncbi:hypothetical protein A2U01_0037609, partial [Trifolium medium]|nr:hypothetical protein [Trifolium medium]
YDEVQKIGKLSKSTSISSNIAEPEIRWRISSFSCTFSTLADMEALTLKIPC